MNYLVFLCSFFISTVIFSQEIQEKYQRAKISYSHTDKGLQKLEALGLPVDHGIHKKGHFVISDFSVSELSAARSAGFLVEIMIEDATAHFLQQNRSQLPSRNPTCAEEGNNYETPANFHLGSMGGYLTYQELLDELDEMKASYPDLITTKQNISNFLTEGQPDNSVTPSIGGNGIKWVKISDNPDTSSEGEPQILYSAIHHAREPASLSQLVFYMWYLLENYDSAPEVKNIIDNTELYFVPVINPDGYLYNQVTNPNGGGFWRKNRKNGHGVDNNRNYNYFIGGDPNNGSWGGEGTSGNTGSDIYRGTAPFSEVENQAVKWFVENHNFVMAFNNHTSGNLLLYPFGYTDNVPTPENDLFEAVGNELVSRNGFTNQISADLYPAAGTSDDFMYGTVGTHNKIYSYTPEIGPTFWPPSNQIIPICKSMMYLNLTSSKMVNNFAAATTLGSLFIGNELNQTLDFDIKRLGIVGNGDFTVSLNPISNNITTVGSSQSFSSMDLLETQSGSIGYSVATGTTFGEPIVLELVVDNGSYNSTTRITKRFGELTTVFEDPADSTTGNYTNNGWGTTSSTFVSPSSCITDSPAGDYNNNQNKTIALSDEIDLSDATAAELSFFAKWEIENDWDYVQVEISIDNGTNWEAQCGKFTNVGSSNGFQPEGEPVYDGIQNDWVLEEINLSDYLGESILVRFQFASDGGVTEDGFYFDDLMVSISDDKILNISDISEHQFTLFPNPVQHILNINSNAKDYSIEMFNIQGQRVFQQDGNSENTTLDYSSFANGVYLLKINSNNAVQTFKIVKQ